VDVKSQPADTFVAEDGALGKGVLLQGDDGVDRHNIAVDGNGRILVTEEYGVDIEGYVHSIDDVLAAGLAAEGQALGKGVLLQGDDGTDRHNVAVDASGNLQVDVVGALPAGSAAIGKLAANSGVDIGDVDVLSLPTLPAGDNNIGNVDVASALPAGNNAIGKLAANSGVDIGDVDVLSLPNKLAAWTQVVININTATTTELIAANAGHTYTILTVSLTIAAENNLTLKSAANAKTGPMDFGKTGESHGWQANFWPVGIKCVTGEALNLTTTTTGQVSGIICVLDES
jgi:hypothetical protein